MGPIDILINNAGVSTMNHIWALSEKEWDFNFAVNAKGVFLVTRAVIPAMMERRRGAIVNTASMAGKTGPALLAHYAASKWACIGFTMCCATELGPYGIRVNCVCPGFVATNMQREEIELGSGAPRFERRRDLQWLCCPDTARPHRNTGRCGSGRALSRFTRG